MTQPTFADLELAPELLKALHQKGYTRPTSIQLEAIPAAMEELPPVRAKQRHFYYRLSNTYWITRAVNRGLRVYWY